MLTLASLRAVVITAAVLPFGSSPLSASTPTIVPPPTAVSEHSVRRDEVPILKHIQSPWGYWEWYWVVPGRNELECSGTGNLFIYHL